MSPTITVIFYRDMKDGLIVVFPSKVVRAFENSFWFDPQIQAKQVKLIHIILGSYSYFVSIISKLNSAFLIGITIHHFPISLKKLNIVLPF
jgi:hypothetical protein